MKAREFALRLHRWTGLAVGAIVVLVSLTGAALLVMRPAASATAEAAGRDAPPGVPMLPVSRLLESARAAAPGATPSSLAIQTGSPRSAAVSFFDHPAVRVDLWDASLIETEPPTALRRITALHVNLMLGRPGRLVVALSVTAMLGLIVLGVWLWWPTRRSIRRAFLIEPRRGLKRANYDFHNVLGFYSAALLFVLGATGVLMAFPSLLALGGRVANAASPSPRSGEAIRPPVVEVADSLPSLDRLWETGRVLFPEASWQRIFFARDEPSVLRVEVGAAGPEHPRRFHRIRVGPNGEVQAVVPFGEERASVRLGMWVDELHMGSVSRGYRVAAFVACLIGGLLPITGALIWWPRWRRRQRGEPDSA